MNRENIWNVIVKAIGSRIPSFEILIYFWIIPSLLTFWMILKFGSEVMSHQETIIFASIFAFIVGDGVSTGFLPRYDLPEAGFITRKLCSEEPSFACAVISRVGILCGVGVVYISLLQMGSIHAILVAYLIPLMVAIWATMATFWNVSGIISEIIENRGSKSI